MPYASPYETIFAFDRWAMVTAVGSTPKMCDAVAVWMSCRSVNARTSPGSSARWAMQRSSIWL